MPQPRNKLVDCKTCTAMSWRVAALVRGLADPGIAKRCDVNDRTRTMYRTLAEVLSWIADPAEASTNKEFRESLDAIYAVGERTLIKEGRCPL